MQNLINKLDNINFNTYNEKQLISNDGWAVGYSINLNDTHGICESMFQVVIRVTYKGALVMNYGCVTIEETNQFGLWFIIKKVGVNNAEYKERRENELDGKALYNLL
jgi:hypothetical protein